MLRASKDSAATTETQQSRDKSRRLELASLTDAELEVVIQRIVDTLCEQRLKSPSLPFDE